MKKALFILAAAVAVAAGCTRETINDNLPEEEGQPMVFRATAEASETSADTKVTYYNDTYFSWSNGDEIGILASNNGYPVWNTATYTGLDGVTVANFTTGTYHNETEFMGLAVYPAAAAISSNPSSYNSSKNTFTLGLPSQYNLENVSPVMMPLVAKVKDTHAGDLNFKHVGGAVKVTFQNVPDSHVKTFRLLSNKKICGEFDLSKLGSLGTDNCKIVTASTSNEEEKVVEVKYMSTGFKQYVTVYFPVPTGSMRFGVEVLLDGNDFYRQEIGATTNTIGRRTILQMPLVVLYNNVGPITIGTVHYNTIQEAVDAATAGQTINVKAGTYEENLTVSKAVTIQGAGATTIIKGSITINGATYHLLGYTT